MLSCGASRGTNDPAPGLSCNVGIVALRVWSVCKGLILVSNIVEFGVEVEVSMVFVRQDECICAR